MFYFIIKIIVYFLMLLSLYYFYNKDKMNVLEFLIIIFNLNIYIIFIYLDYNVFYGLLVTILIVLIKKIYDYVVSIYFDKNINSEKLLIKEGLVNFKELINCKYTYQKLINELRKKGVFSLDKVQYCFMKNNDLIVIKHNMINYPISIIVDGKVLENNLLIINKDNNWLNDEISNHNLIINNIDYAYYKKNKIYFITNV